MEPMKIHKLLPIILALTSAGQAQDNPLRAQAQESLRRGIQFFHTQVAVEGTYVWEYNEDLSKREGEGVARPRQGWVQPPGTPAVGAALLSVYTACGESSALEAARETARGLMRGQLLSGGWTYSIDFDPKERKRLAYRNDGDPSARNVTTLDDDTTQAAVRFLMHMDRALKFSDATIHESVQLALESLLRAQYPNGAWPQGYSQPPDPARHPVKPAAYPESWPREWPGNQNYWQRYTFNDHVLANTVETLFEAYDIYQSPDAGAAGTNLALRCRVAAQRAGDFILLAQMPEPQPAWAQQYDFDMHPAWARKFEPPAVTAGESQQILRTLLLIYRRTGKAKFLEPIPRALNYLRRSRLSGGGFARFYELRTNKPLYFTLDYKLTYDDSNMPTHYAFKTADKTDAVARDYEQLKALPPDRLEKSASTVQPKVDARLESEVKAILAAQDAQGRWVEEGGLRYHRPKDPSVRVIRCSTFIKQIETLSRYLEATK